MNDIIDGLLEMNGKACRKKRAHKCPLVALRYESYDSMSVKADNVSEKQKTHRIIIRVLVYKTVILQVVLCGLWCIFFLNSLMVERKNDQTQSLLTHGTTPVYKDIGGLKQS